MAKAATRNYFTSVAHDCSLFVCFAVSTDSRVRHLFAADVHRNFCSVHSFTTRKQSTFNDNLHFAVIVFFS